MARLLLAALLALLAPVALAQTCTTSWTNPAGGAWETAGNWSAGVPSAASSACIALAGTYTVTLGTGVKSVATLTVGGASGVQTFNTAAQLSVSSATVRSSGRMELLNIAGGGGDGLYASGTVVVEGILIHNSGTTLLGTAGVLDVAPGGTLRAVGNGVGSGGAGSLIRVRGLLEATGCPPTTSGGRCSVNAPIEVLGGTVRASGGVFFVTGGGTFSGGSVDAASGATLYLSGSASAGYTVSGTLSGAPVGQVYANGGSFAAAPGEAVLNVTGTGLLLGGSVNLTSAGGTFLNTGVLTHAPTGSNFAALNGTTLRNTGRFVLPGVGFGFRNGGLLRNEASGTVEISSRGGLAGVGGSDGRVENAGLILANGSPAGPGSGATAGDIGVPYDGLPGSTIRVQTGRLDLTRGGSFRDAAFDVPAGSVLIAGGVEYIVTGTLSGTPAGDLYASGSRLAAGPGGATLAVGGTGFQLVSSAFLTSAGGAWTNTGLLVHPQTGSNFASIDAAVLHNEGRFLIDRSGFGFRSGGLVRNEPGGVVELAGGAGIGGVGGAQGRFENAGLLLKTGGGTSGFTTVQLRSLPGSEFRVLAGRLDLPPPGARSIPDGATLTGTGQFLLPLEIEGAVSPGTPERPLAALGFFSAFRLSLVAGSPRVVVDVAAGGASDTLTVGFGSGAGNTRLGGALVVRVQPGFVPAMGDQWTILTSQSPDGITGQFAQVVAEGAPSGIAFVTERAPNGASLVLRAVATAPGGAVTVSTTRPVSGGVRSIFLTGPGAGGVSAARLECRSCLDAAAFGTVPAQLIGSGALREARFDLTSPRAFGLYDLVMTRPGLTDERVPVTVRPYVSYIQTRASVTRGIGVRPASTGRYNWSGYDVFNTTNTDAPAYTFAVAGREDERQVDIAIASGNAFVPGVVVFYESRTTTDPTAGALTFARIASGRSVPLSYGLSVDPGQVLFPEQTPTGPDDPRLRFGDARLFNYFAVQHTSFARAVGVVELALRNTQSLPLQTYLGGVDTADSGAVRVAIGQALESAPSYVGGTRDLLDRTLAGLNATSPTPAGLTTQASAEFARTLDAAAFRLYADLEYAYRIDLETAPANVRALLEDEYGTLGGARPAADVATLPVGRAIASLIGSVCRSITNTAIAAAGGAPPAPPRIGVMAGVQCGLQGNPPPRPDSVPVPSPNTGANPSGTIRGIGDAAVTALSNITRNISSGSAPFSGGTCGGAGAGAGSGAGGGGGGGGSCTPPSAPADPNDKTADTNLRCQFGTVIVGGVQQTRCVRYFVPLAEAQAPVRYSVQFENLPQATANAEFVTVTDTLDASFNPATLRVLATSSDSTFTYSVSGQVVTFRFTGIDLPPNVTSPEGQGFITYEVTPRPTVTDGSVLRNRASIVFDFNPAIATPEVVHEVRQTADVSAVISAPDFVVVGQPQTFTVVVANTQGDTANDAAVTIDTGGLPGVQVTTTGGTCSGTAPVVCTFGALAANAFERITVTSATAPVGQNVVSATATTSAFDGFAANDSDAATLTVATVAGEGTPSDLPRELTLTAPWPNPARGAATLRWGLPAAAPVEVRVYDLLGREVAVLADETQEAGWHEAQWDARVASGVYLVRVRVGGDVRTRRMTVIR